MKPAVWALTIFFVFAVRWRSTRAQREPGLPLSAASFRPLIRIKQPVPAGRSATLDDVIIRHYGRNSSRGVGYHVRNAKRLLSASDFDPLRPTLLYAHGYVELASDESVARIVEAYRSLGNCGVKPCAHCDGTEECKACGERCAGAWNVLVLDWANLGFGNYLAVALDLKPLGAEVGRVLHALVRDGLSLDGLHLVGHSMGAHLLAAAARELKARGLTLPRLTGLDPAYPGFYPPLLSEPMSREDARFVEALHTNGGGYGAPDATAHADYWPNGGLAKQPGCPAATLPLTSEDFCSHWRSWEVWAEAVQGGLFAARLCASYDAFLRGLCEGQPLAYIGLNASSQLRGNWYLRTGARPPYALGLRGAS